MSVEMKWQVDERTIRDCPGNRTELEWRKAVREMEEKLRSHAERCSKCGQSLHGHSKYVVHETQAWLSVDGDLPRNRWGLSANAPTLTVARKLQKFMGPRATIWIRTSQDDRGATYEVLS